jgi:hypothetical protein
MPGRRITSRSTRFDFILPLKLRRKLGQQESSASSKREVSNAGFKAEITVGALGVFTNSLFVIGCIMFFEIWPMWVYNTGLWLFLMGSLMNVGLAAYSLWEGRVSSRDQDNMGSRDEIWEHLLYILSGLAFAVGSIMWMPFLYTSQWKAVWGHGMSAWCFIWGSLGLVLASIWNAFGLMEESSKRRDKQQRDPRHENMEIAFRRLSSIALCCTAVGGALFVAGSFLFRPGFENACSGSGGLLPASDRFLFPRHRWENSYSRFWDRRPQDASAWIAADHHAALLDIPFTPGRAGGRHGATVGIESRVLAPDPWDDGYHAIVEDEEAEEVAEAKLPGGPVALLLAASRVAAPAPPPGATGLRAAVLPCVDIVKQGTWIYLWGSVSFLAQSILSLACSAIMHRHNQKMLEAKADPFLLNEGAEEKAQTMPVA